MIDFFKGKVKIFALIVLLYMAIAMLAVFIVVNRNKENMIEVPPDETMVMEEANSQDLVTIEINNENFYEYFGVRSYFTDFEFIDGNWEKVVQENQIDKDFDIVYSCGNEPVLMKCAFEFYAKVPCESNVSVDFIPLQLNLYDSAVKNDYAFYSSDGELMEEQSTSLNVMINDNGAVCFADYYIADEKIYPSIFEKGANEKLINTSGYINLSSVNLHKYTPVIVTNENFYDYFELDVDIEYPIISGDCGYRYYTINVKPKIENIISVDGSLYLEYLFAEKNSTGTVESNKEAIYSSFDISYGVNMSDFSSLYQEKMSELFKEYVVFDCFDDVENNTIVEYMVVRPQTSIKIYVEK